MNNNKINMKTKTIFIQNRKYFSFFLIYNKSQNVCMFVLWNLLAKKKKKIKKKTTAYLSKQIGY